MDPSYVGTAAAPSGFSRGVVAGNPQSWAWIHRFPRRLDTVAVRQSRSAENQVGHYMRSRPIVSDSAHGAESVTGDRWTQA